MLALPSLLLGAAVCLAATPAAAQQESASSTSRTQVLAPLSLTKTKDMDFGWVFTQAASRVRMAYDGSNGDVCTPIGTIQRGGECQAAEFVGYGDFNQRVRISLPPRRRVTLTGPSGSQNMQVRAMTIYAVEGINRIGNTNPRRREQYRITDADGLFIFRVGGRLHVNANQQPGIYSGTFTVTVDYF